jgi:hypothetical protein
MGWASAGDIFCPVAQALIDLGADDVTKRAVLGTLISKLQDGDWDTEGEAVDEFRDDPLIVQLFMERGVYNYLDGDTECGHMRFPNWRWELSCSNRKCGVIGEGDGTAKEHDRLVHLWAEHDKTMHDSDGAVPGWALIIRN